jgi:hypothetical protein
MWCLRRVEISWTERVRNVEVLHLSELIGTASHPDMQKLQITGFFFENRLHWQFEFKKKIYIRVCPTFIPKFIKISQKIRRTRALTHARERARTQKSDFVTLPFFKLIKV